jgi:hypothetical protein
MVEWRLMGSVVWFDSRYADSANLSVSHEVLLSGELKSVCRERLVFSADSCFHNVN